MKLILLFIISLLPLGLLAVEEDCPPAGLPAVPTEIKQLSAKMVLHAKVDYCQLTKACEEGMKYTLSGVIKDKDACNNEMNTQLKENSCGINPEEFLALRHYTGHYYQCMNAYLRQKEYQNPVIDKYISLVTTALKNYPVYQGFVVRGANLPDHIKEMHQEGKVVVYDGFTSTSTKAGFGAQDVFIIKSETARMIMGTSVFPNENEALYAPGTKFEIVKAISKDNKNYYIMAEVRNGRRLTTAEKNKLLVDAKKFEDDGQTEVPGPMSAIAGKADSWSCEKGQKAPTFFKQINLPLIKIPKM